MASPYHARIVAASQEHLSKEGYGLHGPELILGGRRPRTWGKHTFVRRARIDRALEVINLTISVHPSGAGSCLVDIGLFDLDRYLLQKRTFDPHRELVRLFDHAYFSLTPELRAAPSNPPGQSWGSDELDTVGHVAEQMTAAALKVASGLFSRFSSREELAQAPGSEVWDDVGWEPTYRDYFFWNVIIGRLEIAGQLLGHFDEESRPLAKALLEPES